MRISDWSSDVCSSDLLACNVLGIAEHASALRYPNGAEPPGPAIHVLEQVSVDGLEVPDAQAAGGERFRAPLPRHFLLEGLQPFGVADIERVDKDARTRIAVRIVDGLIHEGEGVSPWAGMLR